MENFTEMHMLQVQGDTFHPVPPYWREDMCPVDHYLGFVIAVVTRRRCVPVPVAFAQASMKRNSVQGTHTHTNLCIQSLVLFSFLQELLLSWGVDGKLCLWNSYAEGYEAPIATLLAKDDYPIYAVGLSPRMEVQRESDGNEKQQQQFKRRLVVGGGSDGGFVGTPVYLYDFQE
jgi:hypothetical protein